MGILLFYVKILKIGTYHSVFFFVKKKSFKILFYLKGYVMYYYYFRYEDLKFVRVFLYNLLIKRCNFRFKKKSVKVVSLRMRKVEHIDV